MSIIIDPKIFDTFEELQVGIIHAKNIKKSQALSFLRKEEEALRDRSPILMDLPELKQWRLAYKVLGVKKGNRVSVESLLKRVLKGNSLPHISGLVDLYNAISIKHVFPCGGEDLNSVQGDIHLTYALGNEQFMQIGSSENEAPQIDEIVYKDNIGCLCRCFNWREADRTKLTENTEEAIFVIESLSLERKDQLQIALDEFSGLLEENFQSSNQVKILNANSNVFTF